MKWLLAMVAVLGVAACGTTGVESQTTEAEVTSTTGPDTTERSTTTTGRTTPTTAADDRDADEVEDDRRLIVQVWEDYTASWETGTEAGLAFLEDNVYPDLGLTAEGCRIAFDLGPADTFKEVIDLDEETIEPAYDWEMPQGPRQGEVPDGWVYVMTIRSQQFRNGEPADPVSAEVHVTVVGERAYFFYTCNPAI